MERQVEQPFCVTTVWMSAMIHSSSALAHREIHTQPAQALMKHGQILQLNHLKFHTLNAELNPNQALYSTEVRTVFTKTRFIWTLRTQ